MNLYVNGFHIAVSSNHKEFVFHFLQNGPEFQPDGTIPNVEKCIGEYVMSEETAKSFYKRLRRYFDAHPAVDFEEPPRLIEADR